MVVVDSSALIPLAWVGRLDLVSTAFDDIRTTEAVREEALTGGKRGTAALDEFLADVAVHTVGQNMSQPTFLEGASRRRFSTRASDRCSRTSVRQYQDTPDRADEVASMDGIAVADASVILLAEGDEEILLANDKGLIEVARSHGVECWWVTTLLISCTKDGDLTAEEATDLLYDLVNEGINLHPKVYSQVQKKLREFED